MWPFRWRKHAPDPGYEVFNPSEPKGYVNILLLDMVNSLQRELILRESDCLPHVQPYIDVALPTFAAVSNRVKVMANLDPVLYPDPKEASSLIKARIQATNKMHDFTVHLLFNDQGDRKVHLRLEDLGPSPEYND